MGGVVGENDREILWKEIVGRGVRGGMIDRGEGSKVGRYE